MQALFNKANTLVVVNNIIHQNVITVDDLQRLHTDLSLARINQMAQKHKERRDVLLELRTCQYSTLL